MAKYNEKIISRRVYQREWAKRKRKRKLNYVDSKWVLDMYEYIRGLGIFEKDELDVVYHFLRGVDKLS